MIGIALASLDQAKIKLGSMHLSHLYGTINDIASTIKSWYGKKILKQLYYLVGNVDLIGDPLGFYESMKEGVQDLFYVPVKTLIDGKGT